MAKENSVNKEPRIVFCSCSYYDIIADDIKQKVYGSLIESGLEVEAVADLCGMAARKDPILQKWSDAESLKIVACFNRTVRWLFHAAGVDLPEQAVEIFNMRVQDAAEIVHAITGQDRINEVDKQKLPQKTEGWIPWFPVIDYSRCVNCKQCLNFCLFGTYTLSDEGRVTVANPSSCKTNCPACARVCPQKAIIFPKYGEAPINGDEVSREDDKQTEDKHELGNMLKGNVYDMIRGRTDKGKRFSMDSKTDSKPSFEQLRKKLDIPLDVLKSLSPAELQRVTKKSRENKTKENQKTGSKDINIDE